MSFNKDDIIKYRIEKAHQTIQEAQSHIDDVIPLIEEVKEFQNQIEKLINS